MNCVTISGFIATDPVCRYTLNGNQVLNFVLAVSKGKKLSDGGYNSNFFTVDAWGKTAEFASERAQKRDFVFIEGRLDNDTFEKLGTKQIRTKIIAERIEFPPERKNTLERETMGSFLRTSTTTAPAQENSFSEQAQPRQETMKPAMPTTQAPVTTQFPPPASQGTQGTTQATMSSTPIPDEDIPF